LLHPFIATVLLTLIAISGLISTPATPSQGLSASSNYGETPSRTATSIQHTISGLELKKLNRLSPQGLYERNVETKEGSRRRNSRS
jgi:hypothetical protein